MKEWVSVNNMCTVPAHQEETIQWFRIQNKILKLLGLEGHCVGLQNPNDHLFPAVMKNNGVDMAQYKGCFSSMV